MLRETKKMTQVRLGLELGVAQETISVCILSHVLDFEKTED